MSLWVLPAGRLSTAGQRASIIHRISKDVEFRISHGGCPCLKRGLRVSSWGFSSQSVGFRMKESRSRTIWGYVLQAEQVDI